MGCGNKNDSFMAAFIFFQTFILILYFLFHRILEYERDPQRSSSFNPSGVAGTSLGGCMQKVVANS